MPARSQSTVRASRLHWALLNWVNDALTGRMVDVHLSLTSDSLNSSLARGDGLPAGKVMGCALAPSGLVSCAGKAATASVVCAH